MYYLAIDMLVLKDAAKNPNTPHTLLEEIPECEVIISFMYPLIFFIFASYLIFHHFYSQVLESSSLL